MPPTAPRATRETSSRGPSSGARVRAACASLGTPWASAGIRSRPSQPSRSAATRGVPEMGPGAARSQLPVVRLVPWAPSLLPGTRHRTPRPKLALPPLRPANRCGARAASRLRTSALGARARQSSDTCGADNKALLRKIPPKCHNRGGPRSPPHGFSLRHRFFRPTPPSNSASTSSTQGIRPTSRFPRAPQGASRRDHGSAPVASF